MRLGHPRTGYLVSYGGAHGGTTTPGRHTPILPGRTFFALSAFLVSICLGWPSLFLFPFLLFFFLSGAGPYAVPVALTYSCFNSNSSCARIDCVGCFHMEERNGGGINGKQMEVSRYQDIGTLLKHCKGLGAHRGGGRQHRCEGGRSPYREAFI